MLVVKGAAVEVMEAAVVKNITPEEVGEWRRVTDAVIWIAKTASAQVGRKRFLVPNYRTGAKQ